MVVKCRDVIFDVGNLSKNVSCNIFLNISAIAKSLRLHCVEFRKFYEQINRKYGYKYTMRTDLIQGAFLQLLVSVDFTSPVPGRAKSIPSINDDDV